MISRITASVLALALCGTPASALGTASSGSAATQARSSIFISGAWWRSSNQQAILDWAGSFWSAGGLTIWDPAPSRQEVSGGYVLYEDYYERFSNLSVSLCRYSDGMMEYTLRGIFHIRNRSVFYNNAGRRGGGNFYNRDSLDPVEFQIRIPISLTLEGDAVTHRLNSDVVVIGNFNRRRKEILEQDIERFVRQQGPLVIRPATSDGQRAARLNPTDFIDGWATGRQGAGSGC
ncbi:hypothetical protein [Maricaulis sp.]|uniref:hypothetical protein n=1 Tax=Maricaulis sp. TaxID=1486257 RepID=UPI0025C293C0|nr:hypothetical protein [Maricaulis sp.]